MMTTKSALLLLIIITQTALLINGTTDCEMYRYMYTLQPPEAVTCSPYVLGILNLTCAVSGGIVEDIQWYFMPEESSESILLTNSSQVTIVQSEFEGDYSVIITIGNLTNDDVGYYWCQGLIQHEDHTHELSMSDRFHLLTEDRYFPFVCPKKALKSSDVGCAAIFPRPVATTSVALPEFTTEIKLLISKDESTTIEPTRTSLFTLPSTSLASNTKLSPTSEPTVIVTDPITDKPPSGSQTDTTTTLSPPDQNTLQLSDIILYAILGLLGFLIVLVFSLSIVISILCCKKHHRTIDGKETHYDQFSTESEAPHGTMTLKSLDTYPLGPPPPPPYRLPIHPSHSDTMTSSSSGVYDEIHTVVSQYGTQTCMFPLYQEIQTPSLPNCHLTCEAQDSALGGESSDGDSSQHGHLNHSYDHPSLPKSHPVLQDIVCHQNSSMASQHDSSEHQRHGFHSALEHAEQTEVQSSIEDSSDFTNCNLQVTPPPSEQNVITSTLTGSSNSGADAVALDLDLIAAPVEFVDENPHEEGGSSSSSTPLPAIPEHPYHVLENNEERRFKPRDLVTQEGGASVEAAPSPQILHRLSFSEDEGYDRLVGPPHIYHILQKSPSLVQPRIRECSPTSGYHHLDNRIEQEAPPAKASMHHHASLLPQSLTHLDDSLTSQESSTVSSNELFDDPQYNVSPKRVINGHGVTTATKPHRNSHSGQVTTLERKRINEKAINLSKYRGDYERDPTYMVHKLTDPITKEDSGHANACPLKSPIGSNKSTSLPDITHTYQSLHTFTRDPLRNYEILKNCQLTSDSSSTNV